MSLPETLMWEPVLPPFLPLVVARALPHLSSPPPLKVQSSLESWEACLQVAKVEEAELACSSFPYGLAFQPAQAQLCGQWSLTRSVQGH